MARASDPIARFLAQSEHSPLTIKNYRSDLAAFAAWFQGANGEPMEPARITPTDLRQFKRWLVEQRRLKPSTVNRKLATLKSFLTWATRAGLTSGLPVPATGQARSGPRPIPHEQLGPRWLDRREQNSLLRAVERSGAKLGRSSLPSTRGSETRKQLVAFPQAMLGNPNHFAANGLRMWA